MTPERLLLATAEYIDKHGLSRGGLRDSLGRRCTVSIMSHLSCDIDAALAKINALIGPHIGVGQWSDNTAPEEVAATLRRLATTSSHERELPA